jgi:hypothetical protein
MVAAQREQYDADFCNLATSTRMEQEPDRQ